MAWITSSYRCRPPLEEINYFEQNAPVEDDALPPVLDVEATPTSPTCHRHLTQEGAIADMQVMLQEMERHYRKRPIIYTNLDFYEAILSDGALMDYPIWVRSTKHHPPRSTARAPGISGSTNPTGGSRASAATSTRTPSTAQRSSGTPS